MKILSINCYEAVFSNKTGNLFIAAPSGTPAFDFLARSIDRRRIIPLKGSRTLEPFINDEEVIAKTDINQKIKEFGITHFLPSYRNSLKIEAWVKENKLKILFSPFELQKRLENKIYFDKLLKKSQVASPASVVLNSIKDIELITAFPVVAQLPESEGSEGTFVARSLSELKNWWRKCRPKTALVREFINGLPYGATIIVSKSGLLLSAVRAQASTPLSPKNTPFGVQWLPSAKLSRSAKRNIENSLIKVGEILRGQKYLGVANIDFILHKDCAYILECNPRFSAATSQLALNAKLLHNCDLTFEHIKAFSSTRNSAVKKFLPKTSFAGCSLEVTDFIKDSLNLKIKVDNPLPKIGYYYLDKDKLFCSTKKPLGKAGKTFFFYTSLSLSKRIFEETSLASIYTDFPCYFASADKLSKNKNLKSLLKKVSRIVA
jgi:predicted ATP-grasp superfamily ATP-dependent carboligase